MSLPDQLSTADNKIAATADKPGTWDPHEPEKLTTGICACNGPVWLPPLRK